MLGRQLLRAGDPMLAQLLSKVWVPRWGAVVERGAVLLIVRQLSLLPVKECRDRERERLTSIRRILGCLYVPVACSWGFNRRRGGGRCGGLSRGIVGARVGLRLCWLLLLFPTIEEAAEASFDLS